MMTGLCRRVMYKMKVDEILSVILSLTHTDVHMIPYTKMHLCWPRKQMSWPVFLSLSLTHTHHLPKCAPSSIPPTITLPSYHASSFTRFTLLELVCWLANTEPNGLLVLLVYVDQGGFRSQSKTRHRYVLYYLTNGT